MRPELVIGKHSYFWYDAMLEAIVAINILFHDDCRMLVFIAHFGITAIFFFPVRLCQVP